MSEILSLNLPAIFIPSPYVANNHQYYNAMEIKNNGGGEVIEEKDLTSQHLISMINKVLGNQTLYNEMKSNLEKMSMNNSSDLIYKKLKEKRNESKKEINCFNVSNCVCIACSSSNSCNNIWMFSHKFFYHF